MGANFTPYLVTVTFESGLFDGELGSTFFDGLKFPPYVVVGVYEEAYFEAGDDCFACEWIGAVDVLGADDLGLGLGDALWVGWDVALTRLETDCSDLDPVLHGDTDGTAWLENARLGLGFGPLSDAFEDELAGQVQGWEADYAPYAFSGFVGVQDESTGDLVGLETNLALSFALDDDGAWRTDGDSLLTQPATEESLSRSYVRSFPWYGIYADAVR